MLTGTGYIEFDAADFPRGEQFTAWASALPAFSVTTRRPETGFEARVRAWFLPPVVVTVSWLGPVRFRRTREAAIRDGLDTLTFQLLLSGHARGVAEGVPFRAEPGDVMVQDAALALDNSTTRTGTITVTMPRAFLDDAVPGLDVHGAVLRGGLGSLLASFLRSLPEALDGAELDAAAAIPQLLRDLLAAALPAHAAATHAETGRPLRDRVRRYVLAELGRPITLAALCAGVGASRASLYRAFARDGGVMAFVLEQRLLRARRLLADATGARPVAEVAAATAFRNASDLGRAFRRRFGITPGAARHATPVNPPPAGPVQARFRSWVEEEQ